MLVYQRVDQLGPFQVPEVSGNPIFLPAEVALGQMGQLSEYVSTIAYTVYPPVN